MGINVLEIGKQSHIYIAEQLAHIRITYHKFYCDSENDYTFTKILNMAI